MNAYMSAIQTNQEHNWYESVSVILYNSLHDNMNDMTLLKKSLYYYKHSKCLLA